VSAAVNGPRRGLGVTVGAVAVGPATSGGTRARWSGAQARLRAVRARAWRLAGAAQSFVREIRDPGPVLRVDRARWAGASSLAELGVLTAAWLRGEIASQPGYHGPVDVDEHVAPGLTGALVAVNRAGAVTTGSQAGLVDGEYVQLAWVDAFVDDDLLARLQDAAAGTGYRVVVHVPGTRWVPVTWDRGKVWTSTGWMDAQYWAWHYEGVGDGALEQVLAAHQVAVIDPVPGRNTLWAWLLEAVQTGDRPADAAGGRS
jgi:hypothetical protein